MEKKVVKIIREIQRKERLKKQAKKVGISLIIVERVIR
jgi:hypothetical protein